MEFTSALPRKAFMIPAVNGEGVHRQPLPPSLSREQLMTPDKRSCRGVIVPARIRRKSSEVELSFYAARQFVRKKGTRPLDEISNGWTRRVSRFGFAILAVEFYRRETRRSISLWHVCDQCHGFFLDRNGCHPTGNESTLESELAIFNPHRLHRGIHNILHFRIRDVSPFSGRTTAYGNTQCHAERVGWIHRRVGRSRCRKGYPVKPDAKLRRTHGR